MQLRLTLCSVLALTAANPALAQPVFNRIAAFPTALNMAKGEDRTQETSAEIMTVTEDGYTLIYWNRASVGSAFSELAVHGDHLHLIGRDNQIGDEAVLKQITRTFKLD